MYLDRPLPFYPVCDEVPEEDVSFLVQKGNSHGCPGIRVITATNGVKLELIDERAPGDMVGTVGNVETSAGLH